MSPQVSSIRRQRILFITASYPFGRSEEFAELELQKLARSFEVTVLASDCRGQCRSVEVRGVNVFSWRWSTLRILRSTLIAIFSPGVWRDLRRLSRTLRFFPNVRATLRVLSRHSRAVYLAPTLFQALSENEFSAIYAFWGNSAALSLARFPNRPPLLVRFHGYDLYRGRNAGVVPGQAEIVNASDRIFTVSRDGQRYLQRHYPERAEIVDYVPIGVPRQDDNFEVERKGALRVVSVSYCVSVKRLHIILGAVRICNDRGIDVRWTHIGGGPLLEKLKRDALNADLIHSVRFLGHLAPGWDGLYDHLSHNDYDLALNVSASEGLPIALQEAMSFGIPIAATRVGGNEELTKMSDGITLEPLIGSESLAAVIATHALQSTEKYRAQRQRAQVTQRRFFNSEHWESLAEAVKAGTRGKR